MTVASLFAPPIARRVRQFDTSNWEEVWVVGDLHGCLDALERLLGCIEPGEDELVVFVGDLVRKGPDSAGVCRLVAERDNLIGVRGNNEQKLIDGHDSCPSLSPADEDFLGSLPLVIGVDDALVVHGGVDHRKPLADHSQEELLTLRSLGDGAGYDRPYWFEERNEGRQVFFGHTVLSQPFRTPYAVGLDTGCVYGGRLTAYRWSTGEFVAVETSRAHQPRTSDSVVNPRPPASSKACSKT